jgi:hypothetical protein
MLNPDVVRGFQTAALAPRGLMDVDGKGCISVEMK